MPASLLARQGQQPAVLALLAACSSHSRQSDSFTAGTGNSQLLARQWWKHRHPGKHLRELCCPSPPREQGYCALRAPAVVGAAPAVAHGATGKCFSSLERG